MNGKRYPLGAATLDGWRRAGEVIVVELGARTFEVAVMAEELEAAHQVLSRTWYQRRYMLRSEKAVLFD